MYKFNVIVVVIVICEDKFLFVKECDKYIGEICYNQFVGYLEVNEILVEVVCCEFIEEIGISFNVSYLVGIYNLYVVNGVYYMCFSFVFICLELYLLFF